MAYNQKYRLLRRDSLEHDSDNHLRQSGNSAGSRSTLIILSIVLAVSLCVKGNFMIFAYTYRGKETEHCDGRSYHGTTTTTTHL